MSGKQESSRARDRLPSRIRRARAMYSDFNSLRDPVDDDGREQRQDTHPHAERAHPLVQCGSFLLTSRVQETEVFLTKGHAYRDTDFLTHPLVSIVLKQSGVLCRPSRRAGASCGQRGRCRSRRRSEMLFFSLSSVPSQRLAG